jgi:YbbR domain-containing protein
MKIGSRKFYRRLPLMLASWVLAFLLWLLVIAEEKIEAGFMVPLVFDNIPASVVIDGAPMASIYVQIRGSKQAVENVVPQQIRAHIDLSEANPGDEFVQITPQDIILPKGLAVLGVYPPYLDMKFLARKPVSVKVRTVGKPADGYEVRDVTAIPLQLEVVGPQELVDGISEVETFPVNLSGLKKSFKVKADFAPPGDDVRILELKDTEVVVEVAEKLVKKTFRKVAVKGLQEGVTVSPAAVSLVVEGGYHTVGALLGEQVSVEVNWDKSGSKPSMRPLKASAPPGVTVLEVKPAEVKVK